MTAAEVVAFLDDYRGAFAPPVLTGVDRRAVRRHGRRLRRRRPTTGAGSATSWSRRRVRRASRACRRSRPTCPTGSSSSPRSQYRRPATARRDGEVLVVGASASGVQIADELQRSGRRGDDRRRRARPAAALVPRARHLLVDGRDRSARRALRRGRRHRPGAPPCVAATRRQRRTAHARSQRADGASASRVVGRLMRVDGRTAQCSGSLANLVANADLKQARLLDRIDEFVAAARARPPRSVRRDAARTDPARRPCRPSSTSVAVLDGDLGDRVPPDVPVARPGRVRPAAPGRARRRRRAPPRPVPARPAVHAAPPVELHRRRRARRRRAARSPARLTSTAAPELHAATRSDRLVDRCRGAASSALRVRCDDVLDGTATAPDAPELARLRSAPSSAISDSRVSKATSSQGRRHRRDRRASRAPRSRRRAPRPAPVCPMRCERDHAARQRVPLLRPLAGAVPEVDHLGEARAALGDVAAVHAAARSPRCGRRRSSSGSRPSGRAGRRWRTPRAPIVGRVRRRSPRRPQADARSVGLPRRSRRPRGPGRRSDRGLVVARRSSSARPTPCSRRARAAIGCPTPRRARSGGSPRRGRRRTAPTMYSTLASTRSASPLGATPSAVLRAARLAGRARRRGRTRRAPTRRTRACRSAAGAAGWSTPPGSRHAASAQANTS